MVRSKFEFGGYRFVLNHREVNGMITVKLYVTKLFDSWVWFWLKVWLVVWLIFGAW